MAPLTRSRKRALAAAAAPRVIDTADRLSSLPDEILAQILSFLPAQEAVRTCVLAWTWRDVWKFTRRLLITGAIVEELQEFVDHLLHHRLNASLDECEIKFRVVGDGGCTVNRWIRTCLECQVQTLRVLNKKALIHGHFEMSDMPLISRHLRRLELRGIKFECAADLNLDGCPALEHLEITDCLLSGLKIISPSLKRLLITETECKADEEGPPFQISAPCLVSLRLEVQIIMAPLLESMPELVEAHVWIVGPWWYCDSDSEYDTEDYLKPDGWVFLEGLAQAKRLVLLAHHSRCIFRRDLRMCPTFSNLKTLVLNGYWCEPADCRPVACILEHAPVLENLTVIFSEQVELEYDIVFEGHPTMTNQCLKTIKVKCHTANEGVQNVLKFLSTLNICFNS